MGNDSEPRLIAEMVKMLPPEWRRSPAWKHLQVAQVEFLNGMQILVQQVLERLKLPPESGPELRRIQIRKPPGKKTKA